MITVWGRATSVNVQAVMWALAELGIACERIDVGGAFGGLDTPEFRAMNPNGRIPVLRDRDVFLWESAAIVRYLGAQYGSGGFWPADPLSRAKLDKWAEWMKTSFGPELPDRRLLAARGDAPGETRRPGHRRRRSTPEAARGDARREAGGSRLSRRRATLLRRHHRRRAPLPLFHARLRAGGNAASAGPITGGSPNGRPMPPM